MVLDFDDTLVCHDSGEATFAAMAELLKTLPTARYHSPDFALDGMRYVFEEDPIAYYRALQRATTHQNGGQMGYQDAYPWSAQVMAGLTPHDIIEGTQSAWQHTPTDAPFPKPFLYPEMIELVGHLLRLRYHVYILSATNVWTVRWVILRILNPLLEAQFGEGIGLAPNHVFGISMVLRDRETHQLYKDIPLVRAVSSHAQAYANLHVEALKRYDLMPQLVFPVSAYTGKFATIVEHITRERPLLVAGDSANDLAMLLHGEHRLWIARLDSPHLQYQVAKRAHQDAAHWLVQPTLTQNHPGFLATPQMLNRRIGSSDRSALTRALGPWHRHLDWTSEHSD
ncbi:MAG: hypothetical protein RhofKO_10910 [Rhodothermales bacterium]